MDDLSISRQLETYLRGLTSGAEFQRFACKFVTFQNPDIFPPDKTNFHSGSNPTGQVTKGHPDAWAAYKAGIAAIEVCAIITPGKAVKEIEKDLVGLAKEVEKSKKKVTFLCIVLGLLTDRTPSQEVTPIIEDAALNILGIEKENVRVITGYDLISAISNDPKYSALLAFANIHFSTAPFYEIDSFMARFPLPFPTPAEFDDCRVKAPAESIRTITANLNGSGSCLIWGNGGSGKTVIARLVASEYKRKGFSILCLDISSTSSTTVIEDVINFLSANAHDKLLLIIDNVHGHSRFAERYHEFLQLQEAHGFLAIFLSRIPSAVPTEETPILGFLEMYGAKGGFAHEISADGEAFRNVVTLFQSRGKVFPLGNNITYQQIADKFGHDLYVFSYALQHYPAGTSLDCITPENVNSSKAIERTYLSRYAHAPKKLDIFIKIAALSSLEIPVAANKCSGDTQYHNLFDDELLDGTMLRNNNGDFILTHSSLGNMIIRYHAYRHNIQPIHIVAGAFPLACSIGPDLFSLMENQKYYDYIPLLRALFTDKDIASKLLESQIVLPTRLRNPVLGSRQEWYEQFLSDHFSMTAKALAFTSLSTIRETLKALYHKNQHLLGTALFSLAEHRDILWVEISRTSPHIVIDFLGEIKAYAANSGLDREIAQKLVDLHEYIIQRAVSQRTPYRGVLTRSSLSLGYVASFLKYLNVDHKDAHDDLLSDLLIPSYADKLVQRGLSKPLDHFTKFLEHCRNAASYKCESLLPILMQQKNIDLVLAAFDLWQIDSSIYYMKFWQSIPSNSSQDYVSLLVREQFSEPRKQAMFDKLLLSTIPQVTTLFRFAQLAPDLQQNVAFDVSAIARISQRLLKNSKRINLNQLLSSINELSETGIAGKPLADQLRRLIDSDYEKVFHQLINTEDIRSTIAFLANLPANSPDSLFGRLLTDLRRQSYFEKRLSFSLQPYSPGPLKIGRGKAGERPTVRITQLLSFLNRVDKDYLRGIIDYLKTHQQVLINAILSDHIDAASAFMSELDSIGLDGSVLVDSLISEGLCTPQSLEALANNSLEKDVGYLKAFLQYSSKRHSRLYLGVMSLLLGKHRQGLLDVCSRSETGQFFGFLRWIDKPHPEPILTSKDILKDITGKRLVGFRTSLDKAVAANRKAMLNYLKSKHPDFFMSIGVQSNHP